MVIDWIENYRNYAGLHPLLEEGIAFALSHKDSPVGRYEKGEIFVLVQEGTTVPVEGGTFEYHRNYWDVQIVAQGEEILVWQELSRLEESVPYSEEKDAGFKAGKGISMKITEGMFYVALPQDGHMACRHEREAADYKKLVLKLPVQKR